MQTVVISIGGLVLFPEDVDEHFFEKLTKFFEKLSKKYKIYLVVGGGKTARKYIKLGRTLGLNEIKLDEIGIEITRINAEIFASLLGNSNQKIPFTTDEAKKMTNEIIIMGGTTPGHSTDMVGAELAQKTHASKFIVATNVDGVYDKDPNEFSDAKKYDEITIDELIKKYGTSWESAGKNMVIDGPALGIIKQGKIQTYVLNGKNLDELEKAITNQKFNGTKIKN
ncbi:MAG: UMP kinase [Candidatus Thermoplasmatota archaeon]|nr:UMP kinase [Candidatus Thermoplasmatota archaeon]